MQLQMSETSGGYNNVPYKQWWPELSLIESGSGTIKDRFLVR
jgi:hypothetical protein